MPDVIYPNPDPTFFTRISSNAENIGDFNGDGVEDYYISAGIGVPCALVYIAKSSQPTKPYGVRAISGLYLISGVGDINGDGADDFCMTAPSDAFYRGYFVILSGEKGVSEVSSEENAVPGKFFLQQNHPNPFNPSTKISYSLPQLSIVQLVVHDLLGRKILTLVDGKQPAGSHAVQFDGENLPSGIYLYSLTAGTYRTTKKMLLLR